MFPNITNVQTFAGGNRQNVYQFRKRQGQLLAEEFQLDVDLVMPFPDSGNYAAIGYAQASGHPLEMGVIRNH